MRGVAAVDVVVVVAADVVVAPLEGAAVERAFPEGAVAMEVVSAEAGLPRAGTFHPRLRVAHKPPGEAGRE
jgi:hypothetical protein